MAAMVGNKDSSIKWPTTEHSSKHMGKHGKRERVITNRSEKRNNRRTIAEKMEHTYANRRQEVIDQEPRVEEVRTRWPALFQIAEVNAECQRITTVPLEIKFMAQLDRLADRLVEIIGSRGGSVRQQTNQFLKALNQTVDINTRREIIVKSLMIYLGEDVECLIKEYLDVHGDEAVKELEQQSMAIFVIRPEGDPDSLCSPSDIGIVIDGVTMLDELPSVASACALLLGFIYALNLKYPKELERTFEFFQKVLLELDASKMNARVRSLKTNLLLKKNLE
ncbi:hypothetical protein MATL_G00099990 [Megalops atlanticus]|uniref:Uncharacterized protein n=1 Tax=Megalops atlanticus TaxID=7932 RepID=A0A9D3Q4Z4_MEGAT|nr:hypothetical protein MATL_G00099990 [Megalops atlanticus]